MSRMQVAVIGALLASACSSVTPFPIRTGDVCFRCRRVISDERLGAETVGGGLASKFRAPACLAKYLADHPNDTSAVFVTDYASGRFLPASRAFFVPTTDRNTGERDYMAYKDRAAAGAEAFSRRVATVTWAAVLEQAKKDQRGN